MPLYRGFPKRLRHEVPSWVEDGTLFHIRIALDRNKDQRSLTDPTLGSALLESARFYQEKQRWHIALVVLMPDHLHGLLAFPAQESMASAIGDWKRFHTVRHDVTWQEDFFDHRLRDDELGQQLEVKADYIRNNPVAASLCARPEDWPWKIDSLA